MTPALGVAEFILRYIHDEAGNWADRDVGAGASAGLVLILLVFGFPAPSQLETCLAAVCRERNQASHLVLFQVAAKGESGIGDQQGRENANAGGLGEL